MDDIALQTLLEEMRDDCRVVLDAFNKAVARFERGDEVAYESCAHQLCRLYNAFEQMALRVIKAFENNIDDEQGWHSALLNRLSLSIPGVRPALFAPDAKPPLQELKAFRHVFVHAYELTLDPEKLALLIKYARQVTDRLPAWVEAFVHDVAREHRIEL